MGFYLGDFTRAMMRETVDPARLAKKSKAAARKIERQLDDKLDAPVRRMVGESLQLSRPATNRAYEILKNGLK